LLKSFVVTIRDRRALGILPLDKEENEKDKLCLTPLCLFSLFTSLEFHCSSSREKEIDRKKLKESEKQRRREKGERQRSREERYLRATTPPTVFGSMRATARLMIAP
jgi:hypothetical protein